VGRVITKLRRDEEKNEGVRGKKCENAKRRRGKDKILNCGRHGLDG
jgi:hypothetical protein